VAPARRLAIYTNNDSGYLTALTAGQAGIDIAAIVDTRPTGAAIHADPAREAGMTCLFESQIVATSGYKRVDSIAVRDRSGRSTKIDCSGVAVSGGFTPLIHLASHRGVKPIYDRKAGAFLLGSLPKGWHVAGGVTGALTLETALSQATQTSQLVGAVLGVDVQPIPTEAIDAGSFGEVVPLWKARRRRLIRDVGRPAKRRQSFRH
jgi:NADPH-dependent 2,4-dienoyl-CoA reductase/sulfur reductase-like enzyme